MKKSKCYAKVIKNYQKEHKDFKCERHTDFRLNKYGPGGFMSRHIDQYPPLSWTTIRTPTSINLIILK